MDKERNQNKADLLALRTREVGEFAERVVGSGIGRVGLGDE
jgi:hypothetical protein